MCLMDIECKNSFFVCNPDKNQCEHKSIFPISKTEFFGLFVLSALIGMANVGGIGGGGITVPIVAICWGFTTK